MNQSIPLRRYALRGGVDVNMYNTLLEPAFALSVEAENDTDEEEKNLWNRFDIDAYRKKVQELALPLLNEIVEHTFAFCGGALLPDSVSIFSPRDYSRGGDELHFTIEAQTDGTEDEMQTLLDDAVRDDWNAEFGSHYRISEKLGENYTLCDFLKPEGGATQ